MADDLDEMLDEMRVERETRVRPVQIMEPTDRDAPHSGGCVMRIALSPNSGTVVDLNKFEARAWGEALLKFAQEHGA